MEKQTEEKEGKRIYTAEDCEGTGEGLSLKGKVIVIRPDMLRGSCGNQLAQAGTGPGRMPKAVSCRGSAWTMGRRPVSGAPRSWGH